MAAYALIGTSASTSVSTATPVQAGALSGTSASASASAATQSRPVSVQAAACTYHVYSGVPGQTTFKRHLRGVLTQPVLSSTINDGFAVLALELDHYPTELTWGDLIAVQGPNGVELGRWKFETRNVKWDDKRNVYTMTLTPLVAELQDIKDWIKNYSADTNQPGTPLGPADPSQYVKDGIAATSHLTQGVIGTIGTAFAYSFNNSSPKNGFEQALTYAGNGWWWFCDGRGVCDFRSDSPYTHRITAGRYAVLGDTQEDISPVANAQTVQGFQPQGVAKPYTATATDTNPANPLSIPNIGRRSARLYNDSSLIDQNAVNRMAVNLLALQERVVAQRKLTLIGYTARRPRCGDSVTLRSPWPDPTSSPYAVLGPFLIHSVKEHPNTYTYELDLIDIVSPIVDVAAYILHHNLLMSILNPASGGPAVFTPTTPVSPGQIGSPPNTPTGLAANSYIENSAQVYNAALTVSWSAPATDSTHAPPTSYVVQYRRNGQANWQAGGATGNTTQVITGLVQGTSYDVQVAAVNAGGMSAWTSILTTTTATASAPSVPAGIAAAAGVTSVLVSWNLLAAADVQYYELWEFVGASTAASPPGGATQVFQGQAAAVAMAGRTSNQTYTYWLRARNWSGQYSGWSSYVQATPRFVANGDIAANTITVDRLAAGTLNAGVVMGGYIQTAGTVDGTHAGVRMDGTSIKVYDGTGTNYGAPSGAGVAVELSGAPGTGNPYGFFKGLIRAAQIQGPGGTPAGQAYMAMDFTNQTALQLRVNDGVYDRVIVGQYT